MRQHAREQIVGSRGPRLSRARVAYTLFELVLVLALLVVLAGLTYPSLESMYSDYRLTAATDMVRAGWASARAHAVDEGRPYRFAVVANRGNFRIAPDSPEFWTGANSPGSSATDTGPALVLEDVLPKRVHFVQADALKAGGVDNSADSQLPPGGVDPSMWTSVVTFLPDGTARPPVPDASGRDDIAVGLCAGASRPRLLRIRGLTGVVTVKTLGAEGGRL